MEGEVARGISPSCVVALVGEDGNKLFVIEAGDETGRHNDPWAGEAIAAGDWFGCLNVGEVVGDTQPCPGGDEPGRKRTGLVIEHPIEAQGAEESCDRRGGAIGQRERNDAAEEGDLEGGR